MEYVRDYSKSNKDVSAKNYTETSEPSTSKADVSRPRKAKLKPTSSSTTQSQINPHDWTEEEKMKLAVALQRHGHLDIKKLQEELPTKSHDQIKAYTYWIIKRSRLWFSQDVTAGTGPVPRQRSRIFSKAPIDQWLSAFEDNQANPRDEFRECLAKTFLYISRYEPHPDPKDCGGVDYAAMYEFLYYALNGYPVKAVNPPTAAAILKALEDLSSTIASAGNEKEVEYLNKVKRLVFVENATKRHYGKKGKDSKSSGPIESLMDVKGFNPLSIPYELLKRRNVQS